MGILRTDIVSHSQLSNTSGSVEFDGTTDFIQVPSSSAWRIGNANGIHKSVTIEWWIYLNTTSGYHNAFDINYTGGLVIEGTNGIYSVYGGGQTLINEGILEAATADRWYHYALVIHGGPASTPKSIFLYRDGKLSGAGKIDSNVAIGSNSNNLSIGARQSNGANSLNGFISNFRWSDEVVYNSEFTVPKFNLKALPSTLLLCCQSSTSATEAAVSATGSVTASGNATHSSFNPGLKDDITDTGVVFDGVTTFDSQAFMVPPSGKTTERNRGRGVLGGGYVHPSVGHNSMMYIEIQSQGNAQDFGDLTVARSYFVAGQTSSSTRGLNSGGFASPGSVNTIDFITIANTSNATDFGDTINVRPSGGLSNQTRSVHAGTTSPFSNVIDFVTIATTGDAQNFGDLVEPQSLFAGASSSTRGVFGGGRNNTPSENTLHNTMQFITIATTGDAQDFGDLQALRYGHTGFSSPTRGIFAGGYLTPGQTASIDFFTIATLGNSEDFGDLSIGVGYNGSVTNSTRGVITINDAPNYTNALEFITIATTGNAKDFGDADPSGSPAGKGMGDYPSGISDSHGGVA